MFPEDKFKLVQAFQRRGHIVAFVALMAKTVESHGFEGLLAATIMASLILLALGYMRLGTYTPCDA